MHNARVMYNARIQRWW